MEKPWTFHWEKSMVIDFHDNHGAWSQSKIPWFHGDNSILSMPWDREIVRIIPMNTWGAWNIKPWKTMKSMGSTGIYKNESIESMLFSSI